MTPEKLQEIFGVPVYCRDNTECGMRPQDRCFKANPGPGFFVAYQPSPKNRYYMRFPDKESFIVPYGDLMGKECAHFYEIIRDKCKFFIDIDIDRKKGQDDLNIELFKRHITKIRKRLKNPIVTTSHGKDKFSYHLVYNYVSTLADHKAFMDDPDTRHLLELYPIDWGVYTKNRNMRLLGSRKFGSDRVLVGDNPPSRKKDGKLSKAGVRQIARGIIAELDEPEISDELVLDLPQDLHGDLPNLPWRSVFGKQKDADCFTYSGSVEKADGTEHRFRRVASSRCELCRRTHDRDNTMYLFEVDGKVFRKCYKNKGSIYLGGGEETPPTVEVPKKNGSPREIREILRSGFEEVGKLIEYEEQYCSHNKDLLTSEAGIIASRARMGTGKTNAAAARIKDSPDKRVLVISFRISLTAQYVNDKFAGCGMVGYSDVKSLDNSVNRLVIQPESMYRLKWTKGNRDYVCDEVILDEVDAIINQLTGSTFTKQKNAVRSFKVFKQIIKYAKTIHIMDANLTPRHIKFFQKIRGGSTEIFWNHHNNFVGRSIVMGTRSQVMEKIFQDIKFNRRIYIATNGGESKIQAIKQAICLCLAKEHEYPMGWFESDILTIYQGSMGDENVIKALADPNGEWGKYRVVISSPSVQSGVSYDEEKTFHSVYGLFTNFTNSSKDAAQMLNRVRHPVSSHTVCCVEQRNHNIGPLTFDALVDQISAQETHLVGNFTDYDIDENGVHSYKQNEYFRLWADNEIARNYDLLTFKNNFIDLHDEAGYEIKEAEELDSHIKEKVDDDYGTGRGIAIKKAWELLGSVEDLTPEEAKAMREKIDRGKAGEGPTAQEMTQLKRYGILRDYGIDGEIADARDAQAAKESTDAKPVRGWFQTYESASKRKTFKNARLVARGFDEALNIVKEREQDHRKAVERAILDPERELCRADADIERTRDVINSKNIYQQWAILLEWVRKIGFEDVGDEVEREEVEGKMLEIRDEYQEESALKHLGDVLGKDPRRLAGFAKDAEFKHVLKFINGAIGTLGLSIKAPRRKPYKLVMPMIEDGFCTLYSSKDLWRPHLLDVEKMAIHRDDDSDSDSEDENPFL